MTTTTDVGLRIADLIQDQAIDVLIDSLNIGTDRIQSVDASDPNNLILRMDSGAGFTVRIVRTS